MIDETGKKVWEETFDLWGKPHDHLETRVVGGAILTNVKPREANKNQAISQPFRFPGQYEDEETGLYYNRYRYYMPNEGMYTQRDPIGLAGGNPTTYGYVFNTLQEVDPFGLRCGKPKPQTSPSTPINPLENIQYTKKVQNQMVNGSDRFHNFPRSVEGFGADGRVTTITGGDGIKRTLVEIPGGLDRHLGVFEFIIEPNGSVNHRFFRIIP